MMNTQRIHAQKNSESLLQTQSNCQLPFFHLPVILVASRLSLNEGGELPDFPSYCKKTDLGYCLSRAFLRSEPSDQARTTTALPQCSNGDQQCLSRLALT